MEPSCPQCHVAVRTTDFFCYNCGKNLKPKPLPLKIESLILYYLGSIILPPMGIIWGLRYLKDDNQTAKIHGIILITITVVELIILTVWTFQFVNSAVSQANTQLNSLQGF